MKKFKNIVLLIVGAMLLVGGSAGLIMSSISSLAANEDITNDKTANWVEGTNKTKADIHITYNPESDGVLFLGTLCNGHGLGGGTNTIDALNQLLQRTNVDYAFFGTPTEEAPTDGTTGNGLIPRSTYLETISTNNSVTSYQGVTYRDFTEYDSTSESGRNVYLLGNQSVHGSKTKGETMGINYLTELKNDDKGTGSNPDKIDNAHIWGGFANEFVYMNVSGKNDFEPYDNQKLEQLAGVTAVTPLYFKHQYILSGGQHANAVAFAKEIVAKLSDKEYDTIVLSFDGLFEMANVEAITANEAKIMRQAADKLQKYYNENRIIWLMSYRSAKIKIGEDYYPVISFPDASNIDDCSSPDDYTDNYLCSLTGADQTDYHMHYLIANAKYFGGGGNNSTGYNHNGQATIDAYNTFTYLSESPIKYNYMQTINEKSLSRDTDIPRFYWTRNMFQAMALFDPTTYISNTDNDGQPRSITTLPPVTGENSWKTSIGKNSAFYNNANEIVETYEESTRFNKYVIQDEVKEGLVPTSADLYYYDNNEWIEIEQDEENFYYINPDYPQVVNATITKAEAIGKPVKMTIHCDCPGGFDVNGEDKETNVGVPLVMTYEGDELKQTKSINKIPKLLKLFKVETEVVNGEIDPSDLEIAAGEDRTINYIPNDGYELKSITVDDNPVDITQYPDNYTFANINGNHTIKVVYEPKKVGYTVKYLEKDTDRVLHTMKDVNNALYGTEIISTEEKINIDNYHYVSANVPRIVLGEDKDSNQIILYYQMNNGDDVVKTNEIEKTSQKTIVTTKDELVDYKIKYTVGLEDYVGNATITIIDYLPFEIDEASSTLDGGIYENSMKAIVWNIEKTVSQNSAPITITKNIKLKYKYTDNDLANNDVAHNVAEGYITLHNLDGYVVEDDDDKDIPLEIGKIKITTHHVDKNGRKLDSDVVTTIYAGEEYTTVASAALQDLGYKVTVPNNYKGKALKDTEVTYVYEKSSSTVTPGKKGSEKSPNTSTGNMYLYIIIMLLSIPCLIIGIKKYRES